MEDDVVYKILPEEPKPDDLSNLKALTEIIHTIDKRDRLVLTYINSTAIDFIKEILYTPQPNFVGFLFFY